ncbi:clarin-1-like [Protopterus annectens]|uniref:clarin-1-like n=1 Tax=Protopterus annectens TaxID=7888 RepID=UPI001CFBA667|nr:clarin-1-like [Protopterus annectens]
MPDQQKKIVFCTAGILSFASALTIAAAIGTQLWIKGTVLCKTGAQLVNATGQELEKFLGEIHYGLFRGQKLRQCGLGGRTITFSFFPDLLTVVPASIHVCVIIFSAALIIISLVETGFFMYNAFGKPFETLHGPIGLYLWNFISCCSGFLIMILFLSEVKLHRLSEKIANYKEGNFIFKTHKEQYGTSFWLILICFFTHFLNILLIRLAGIKFPFHSSKETDNGTSAAADLMY